MDRHTVQCIARSVLFLGTLAMSHALHAAERPHVLMISIDGMGADYVTKADEHHLKIPTLRRFIKEGVYSDGVVGVVPTMTYPSHTTLITGVWPNEHGVYNNAKFDPLGTMHGAVFTEAALVKAPTLWQAAHAAGYTTASVGWPVTTGASGIDYSMPANAAFEGRAADGEKVEAVDPNIHFDHPAGLRETLAQDVSANPDLTIDERRFEWTLAILRRYHPGFMTTHLGELDHAEHTTGPFSEESAKAIEMLDGEVAQLISVEKAIDPNAYIVIVSDHGFEPVERNINLNVLFAKAGLIRAAAPEGPASWDAALWLSGGTGAVMLRDPSDLATRKKVEALLREAAMNPDYGIARVLSHEELIQLGGNPDAAFLVEVLPGFKLGAAKKGSVVTPAPHTGTHGYLPSRPELRASFLLMGPGVAHGHDLGVIDMRQIAPTVAQILHVKLPSAKLLPLDYRGDEASRSNR
jgi:predicted AlkP superfamily pyrophosphatase or phosphodiesterase